MPDAPEPAPAEIALAVAEIARRAWEPFWPVWRGYAPIRMPPSSMCCVPSSFALRDVLARTVPEIRWRVVGGRPTKRTPLGGYLDEAGKPQAHLWVEARGRGGRVVADVTADQFGGPAVVVGPELAPRYTANATRPLLRGLDIRERVTVARMIGLFDAAMRQGTGNGERWAA